MLVRIFSLICLTLVSSLYVVGYAADDMWYVSSLNPALVGKSIYLVNAENVEIPFVLLQQKNATSTPREEVAPIVIAENTMQKNESSIDRVLVLDTGKEGQIYTGINIRLTPESKNFRKVARVFIADALLGANSPAWKELEKRTIVYNYTDGEFVNENLKITFPDVSTRYLKVQFVENSTTPAPMNVLEVRVMNDVEDVPEKKIREYVAGNFDISNTVTKKEVTIKNNIFDGLKNVTSLTLKIDEDLDSFRKVVSVESSDDGVLWEQVGIGQLYRINSPVYVGENVTIQFPATSAKFFRVNTDLNIDNKAEVTIQQMALLFKANSLTKDGIKVAVDNTGIATSSYILQKELSKVGNIVPEVIEVDLYSTEVEKTKRKNPIAIYSAIFLIAGILGILRYRATRKA